MFDFLLSVGYYALGIIEIALMVFVVMVVIRFYNWINNKKTVLFSRIATAIFAVVFSAVIIFSMLGAFLQLKRLSSTERIIGITSKVDIGDDAYCFFKGKPKEKYFLIIDGYYDYDVVDEQKTDSDGLVVFDWLVTYSVEPGRYNVIIQDSELEEVGNTEFTVVN